MTEQPLSQLQLDILELELQSWKTDGAKISAFRDKHPHVTPTGYTVALKRLLGDRRAYEHAGGRYAPTLNRINELHRQREADRAYGRRVTDE